jgi:hypothetical protein
MEHPSILLIQELKRDIIYRRMNLPPSARQRTEPLRIVAPLNSTLCRLQSYLKYIGTVKYAKALETLLEQQETNLAWWVILDGHHAFPVMS